MKEVKIMNAEKLNKIDMCKPRAIEMLAVQEGEIVCVAYITTDRQMKRFINNFTGKHLRVCDVNIETNTAVVLCVK